MKIKLQPIKGFYKEFPKYKGKPIYFLGWSRRIFKKYGNIQIRVKINKRSEYFDILWFHSLKIDL